MTHRLDPFLQNLRYGVRQMIRNPLLTGAAVLTLALGVGANTAVYSVVDGILFRPLPLPESHELVNVWSDVTERGGPAQEWLSYVNIGDLEEGAQSIESLAAWGGLRPTLAGEDGARMLSGAQVDPDMFPEVLGVEPALGRGFRPEDDLPTAPQTAILSHAFWQRAYGGDGGVIGTTIQLNNQPTEIIGVMPAGFRPPFVPDAEVWVTPRLDPAVQADQRGTFSWRAVGRLTQGASVERADAELAVLGDRLEERYPESNTGMSFAAVGMRDDIASGARTGLLVLLGAVALVLLVACVNVANLLLVRTAARRGELAVRTAVGADRRRILSQLLTEAGLLAVVGGGAGVLVALLGTELLVALAPPGTPRIDEVGVDGRILGVTAIVTLLAGALFGVVPALRAARESAYATLRESGRGAIGRGSGRTRDLLVVGQVGLAVILLVGAGLLVRSFNNLRTHDLGFQPESVLTMQVNLPGERYDTGDELRAFYDDFLLRLEAIPGVASAAFTITVPLTGLDRDADFNIEGRPDPAPGAETAAWVRQVTPAYFRTMEIPLVAGRGFTPADDENAPLAIIINETFAARHFPDESPIGKRIDFGDRSSITWREVVGVAADVKNFGVRQDSRVAAYLPYDQVPGGYVFPVLRTTVPPTQVLAPARAALAEIDPGLAIGRVDTLDDIVSDAIAADRFVATLLSLFAVIALILSVVGLYGVVAYGVGLRLPEMGVRLAMGAAARDITRMVLRQSMALVGAGIVMGAGGAMLLARLAEGLLFGVRPVDPATFGAVILLLALAGAAAAAIPAVRAGRVDPREVLGSE